MSDRKYLYVVDWLDSVVYIMVLSFSTDPLFFYLMYMRANNFMSNCC